MKRGYGHRQWLRERDLADARHHLDGRIRLRKVVDDDHFRDRKAVDGAPSSLITALTSPLAQTDAATVLNTTLPSPYPAPAPAGCSAGYLCPHFYNPNASPVDMISFVLACEAGSVNPNNPGASLINPSAVRDALAVAHLIYNRMNSFGFGGDAYYVIRRAGQFQCWQDGILSTSNINTFAAIDPRIRVYAQQIVNKQEPSDPNEALFNPNVDYYGLYTFGVPNFFPTPDSVLPTPGIANVLLTPYCR